MRFLIIMYLLSILAGGTGGCTSQKGSKKSKSKKGNTSVTKAKKTREGVLAESKKEDESVADSEDEEDEEYDSDEEDSLGEAQEIATERGFEKSKELSPVVQEATKEYGKKIGEFESSITTLNLNDLKEDSITVAYEKLKEAGNEFRKIYGSVDVDETDERFFEEGVKVSQEINKVFDKINELTINSLEDKEKNEGVKSEIIELTAVLKTMIQNTIGLLGKENKDDKDKGNDDDYESSDVDKNDKEAKVEVEVESEVEKEDEGESPPG